MNRVQIRNGIARTVAIVLVVVLAAGIALALGFDIPILRDIAEYLGMNPIN